MKTDNVCLLITGCIYPNSHVTKLALKNPEERKKQYINSIRYYIVHSKFKYIVYCDSSDVECENEVIELAKEYGKNFEWISFEGNYEKTIDLGKGYAEGEIVKYSIEHSTCMKNATFFVKVTGRLIVKNINSFLRLLNENNSYFEMHNGYVDTRCYFVRKNDYLLYLRDVHERTNDNEKKYLEIVINDTIKKHKRVFLPLPLALWIFGQSGSMGIKYDETYLVHFLKNIKRLLTSWLWYVKRILNE